MLAPEINRSLFTLLNYGDAVTQVIGHRSPDVDSVTSAIAMARLLEQLGIRAVPRIAGPVNRETEFFLKTFGLEAPELLENAAGCQLWLVDHSEYHQAVEGARQARIVGIVDHHGMGDAEAPEMIYVDSAAYVSTATAVYRTYVNCGLDLSRETARLLLAGMMSDSNHMNKVCTALDHAVYAGLKELSGYSDRELDEMNRNRRKAKYDHSGQSDRDMFYSDSKVYEQDGKKYGISNLAVYGIDDVKPMADRMRAFMQTELEPGGYDFLICMVQESAHELQRLCAVGRDPEKNAALMDEAFGADSEKADEDYIHYPGFSRKRDVAPRIGSALEKLSAGRAADLAKPQG